MTIASRSAERAGAAALRLGAAAAGKVLDATDESGVEAFLAHEAPFRHVVVSAAQTEVAAVRELPLADGYGSMDSKFRGADRIARAARFGEGGSLTLVSGFPSVRPRKGAAVQGATNAALEGLTRGLALESAPVRVNCVSPGLVMTDMYDGLAGDARRSMFEGARDRLPAGIVRKADHVAIQIIAFMTDPYATGSIAFVDGGGGIA